MSIIPRKRTAAFAFKRFSIAAGHNLLDRGEFNALQASPGSFLSGQFFPLRFHFRFQAVIVRMGGLFRDLRTLNSEATVCYLYL